MFIASSKQDNTNPVRGGMWLHDGMSRHGVLIFLMGGFYKHFTPNGVSDGALFSHQLPAKGALHEAMEEMLQFLLGLALPGAQGFDFFD